MATMFFMQRVKRERQKGDFVKVKLEEAVRQYLGKLKGDRRSEDPTKD